jgi:hypothetical protein
MGADGPSRCPHWAGQSKLERVTGIEPASSAWKAEVLPLNYTRRNPARLPACPQGDAGHAGLTHARGLSMIGRGATLHSMAVRRRSDWMGFRLVLATIFVTGVIVLVIGMANTDKSGSDLWFEVAKSGLQLAAITVVGAVITAGLRFREERRARKAEQLRAFHNFLTAYNKVKAVRRNLRALGLLHLTEPINAEQANGLRQRMIELNDAQLLLETFNRENAESSLFDEWPAMALPISVAENYLHEVHERWEERGGNIWAGASASAIEELELVRLIGKKRDARSEFENLLSEPLDEITVILHRELYGGGHTSR